MGVPRQLSEIVTIRIFNIIGIIMIVPRVENLIVKINRPIITWLYAINRAYKPKPYLANSPSNHTGPIIPGKAWLGNNFAIPEVKNTRPKKIFIATDIFFSI